jgi:molybdenum cofactor cytidylyltransferase
MGSPKLDLDIGGERFVERILRMLREAAIEHVIVTTSQDRFNVVRDLGLPNVEIVVNTRPPAEEQIGSLRSAVRVLLNRPVDAMLVWPVDYPGVAASSARTVIEAFFRARFPVVVPAYRGKGGHPVLFSRVVFGELAVAPAEGGARAIVRANPGRVARVAVDDPGVLEDVNTPADRAAMMRRIGALPA